MTRISVILLLLVALVGAGKSPSISWISPDQKRYPAEACLVTSDIAFVRVGANYMQQPLANLRVAVVEHTDSKKSSGLNYWMDPGFTGLPAPIMIFVLPVMLITTVIDVAMDGHSIGITKRVAATALDLPHCQLGAENVDSSGEIMQMLLPADSASWDLDIAYTIAAVGTQFRGADSLVIAAPFPAECLVEPKWTHQSLVALRDALIAVSGTHKVSIPQEKLCSHMLRLEIRKERLAGAIARVSLSDTATAEPVTPDP